MVLEHAKCDFNGVKIAIFAAKITQQLEAQPPLDILELQRFVLHET